MVFYRERETDRPPLSRILPHLYLGAETDVTQDGLAAKGISYVLSVSRCSPQPAFLPPSQYLRIPIDDSLRDDLLAWIPQALHFIDGAMSLGCSVIVHCAAGISRSPALAVAYVMYRLGMDLDQAYRFVKERRPTISPNFNFLGQLQLFQGMLTQEGSSMNLPTQPSVKPLDTCPLSTCENMDCKSPLQLSGNCHFNLQGKLENSHFTKACNEDTKANGHFEIFGHIKTQMEQPITEISHQEVRKTPEFTLSLSDKLKTLTLSLNPVEVQRPSDVMTSQSQQDTPKPTLQKPTQLHIASGQLSLSEKRRSLTLSLSPAGFETQPHRKGAAVSSSSLMQSQASSLKAIQKGESEASSRNRGHNRKLLAAERNTVQGQASTSLKREAPLRRSSSGLQKRNCAKENCSAPTLSHNTDEEESTTTKGRQEDPSAAKLLRRTQCSMPVHQQGAADKAFTGCAAEVVEGLDVDQNRLSPINMTVNKLLGWGERMLLGVLLGPRVKLGQPALSYGC